MPRDSVKQVADALQLVKDNESFEIRQTIRPLLMTNAIKSLYPQRTTEGFLLDLTKHETGTFTVDQLVEECNHLARINSALRITRAEIVGALKQLMKEGHVELVSRERSVWRRRAWSRGE